MKATLFFAVFLSFPACGKAREREPPANASVRMAPAARVIRYDMKVLAGAYILEFDGTDLAAQLAASLNTTVSAACWGFSGDLRSEPLPPAGCDFAVGGDGPALEFAESAPWPWHDMQYPLFTALDGAREGSCIDCIHREDGIIDRAYGRLPHPPLAIARLRSGHAEGERASVLVFADYRGGEMHDAGVFEDAVTCLAAIRAQAQSTGAVDGYCHQLFGARDKATGHLLYALPPPAG